MEQPPEQVPPIDPPLDEGWSELMPALPPVGILVGMSDRSLANLAPFGKYQFFKAGAEVIREGQQQDRLHIIVLGKLSITALVDGKEVALNEAFTGECVGEISMLSPGPATASARAVEETTLWSMNIDDFRTYLAAHVGGAGTLLLGMASCLCLRVRHANTLISSHHLKPVEMLPAGRERAITADNTPMQIGFFDRLKKTLVG
jgi:CRP/FNR family cyclic AMP-dependent transcriptional regulator